MIYWEITLIIEVLLKIALVLGKILLVLGTRVISPIQIANCAQYKTSEKTVKYFILFYFILFYFILFYFILFYFILFYFILFYFTL